MQHNTEEQFFFDALFHQRRKHGVYRLVDAPVLEGTVADTHCHLYSLPNPALAYARCAVHGVGLVCNMIDVVSDAPYNINSMEQWHGEAKEVLHQIAPDCTRELPLMCCAVGCHPHNAQHFDKAAKTRLLQSLENPYARAIGEIGLDFHYDISPRDVQIDVFRAQLRIAHELNVPVALHIREAHDVALHVLREEGFPQAGVLLHCFNLGPHDVEPWLENNCYIALGGPLTFKKSDEVRLAAKEIPLNRLLTETDAPYMTPEPLRGVTCWPDHVIFTANVLAQERGCVLPEERSEFFQALFTNALRFFGLEKERV